MNIKMKEIRKCFFGLLLIACFVTSSYTKDVRVRRYIGQGDDWSWNGQDISGQAASQNAWPSSKGDGGEAAKRRTDSKTNRDGRWTASGDRWGSSDIQKKEDDDDMSWGNQPPTGQAQGNNKGSPHPEESGDLEILLRGKPGMDFPNFSTVPETSFDCAQMPSQGYYGDVEAGCQVFHICQPGNRKDSFLCPVGTVFNQKLFVCDWWFNYNCSETMAFYGLNEDIYKEVVTRTPKGDDTPAATTEKMLPWSAQDLDKKRPTKSWAPSVAKQGQPRPDIATKRGAKQSSSSISSSSHHSWSQTDVQQKEVTVAWSSQSTARPLWYGIDGRPARDQSPFGTRVKSSSATWVATSEGLATASGTWTPTVTPKRATTFQVSSTKDWLSRNSLPETSIVPSDVQGVWEQETTKQSGSSPVPSGHQSTVTKSDRHRFSADSPTWGVRTKGEGLRGEASVPKIWAKKRKGRKIVEMNVIPKHKRWY